MNKIKLTAAFAAVLILGQSAALAYFILKTNVLSMKLDSMQPGFQKLAEQETQARDKNTALVKELESLKEDRNNLLSQIKDLLSARNRAEEFRVTAENISKDMQAVQKIKQEMQKIIMAQRKEIKRLQRGIADAIEERDNIELAYEKLSKSPELNEKKDLEEKSRQSEAQVSKLVDQKSKLEIQVAQLSKQLKDEELKLKEQTKRYKSEFEEAVRKNREFEQATKNLPGQFSEMARQNKRLLKETSQMHYNLGVFYTKQKQYDRAVAEFKKALDIVPDDASAHFNLGYIYAEYLVNRKKAIEHFRLFLRLTKSYDKDADWVKKYLLTWETYEGTVPMQ